jgi:hypothetical protein
MLPEIVPVPELKNLTQSSREAEETGCSLLPLLLCVIVIPNPGKDWSKTKLHLVHTELTESTEMEVLR